MTLDGFSGYTEEGLLVAAGGTTARDVTLNLWAFEESIVVTGESPMVDPRRFGVTQNVKREVIDQARSNNGVREVDPGGVFQ